MKKNIKILFITLLLIVTTCFIAGCGGEQNEEETSDTAKATTTEAAAVIDEDGEYWDSEDVALYINTYGRLPENYVTKGEASDMGWHGGNPVNQCGYAIGGDRFYNREGLLPEDETYYECDVDYKDDSRGPCRLIFTESGTVYYTEDHYGSFEQLY